MISSNYEIAGKVVCINSLYSFVHEYCRDYLTEKEADYSVTTSPADIENEKARSAAEDALRGRQPREYPEPYLESLAVYRKITDEMAGYDTILFHGSAVALDGEAYLFTAASGTGKSTHALLWKELFGDRLTIVNDDKPLIKVGEKPVVYGTPYRGKHGRGENTSVPLKAICIVTRASENSIRPVTPKEVYASLISRVYRPADAVKTAAVLKLADRLFDSVGLYVLGCNMDISAAKTAYEGMK